MSADKSPRRADVRAAREKAGLTQTQAAALVGRTLRAWQDWEGGQRNMPQGFWELFLRKTARARAKAIAAASAKTNGE